MQAGEQHAPETAESFNNAGCLLPDNIYAPGYAKIMITRVMTEPKTSRGKSGGVSKSMIMLPGVFAGPCR